MPWFGKSTIEFHLSSKESIHVHPKTAAWYTLKDALEAYMQDYEWFENEGERAAGILKLMKEMETRP